MSNQDLPTVLRRRLRSIASGVRFGKFVSVGAIGAVCDTTVLVTLQHGFGVMAEIATLAGIETAILVMFFINEHWTFADEGASDRESFLGRLKRSHAVRAVGSLTQWVLFVVLWNVPNTDFLLGEFALWTEFVTTLGLGAATLATFNVWLLVAKGTAIGVAMTVNYVFESLFTWQVHAE